jgi:hypothetical protein
MAGSPERGYKPSGSIKDGEYLDRLKELSFPEK